MGKLLNLVRMYSNTSGTGTLNLGSAVPGFLTFAQSGVVDGDIVSYAIKDGTSAECGIGSYNASGPTLARTTVRNSTNSNALVPLTGVNVEVFVTALAEDFREKLTANRTYYVRTDGNDSNTGLANSAGGAFLTIQRAENVARTIDFNGFTVTVSIGDGTYTTGVTVGQKLGQATTANYRFTSTSTIAANVIISTTSASCFVCNAPCTIDRMTLQTTTSGSGIAVLSPCLVQFQQLIFNACATSMLTASAPGAKIQSVGIFTIAGGSINFLTSTDGAQIQIESTTITITGTPAFPGGFVWATRLGGILMRALTFSGGTTGSRYLASLNGVIETAGGGATYFPGNASGVTGTGGQYN